MQEVVSTKEGSGRQGGGERRLEGTLRLRRAGQGALSTLAFAPTGWSHRKARALGCQEAGGPGDWTGTFAGPGEEIHPRGSLHQTPNRTPASRMLHGNCLPCVRVRLPHGHPHTSGDKHRAGMQ